MFTKKKNEHFYSIRFQLFVKFIVVSPGIEPESTV